MRNSKLYEAATFVFLGVFLLAALPQVCVADVKLETANLRLEIYEAGLLKSLVDKESGKEYAYLSKPGPAFWMRRGGQQYPACKVTSRWGKLIVDFDKGNVTAKFDIIKKRKYLALKLKSIKGGPVDSIDLLSLHVKRFPYLGEWINVAYDDDFGICLCAGNIQTNAKMTKKQDYVVMRTIAHKEVALEGTVAVFFGFDANNAKENFLDVMEIVERDFKMPSGAKNRRSPVQEYSYFRITRPTTGNIDELIKWAKRGGFRMILFACGSVTKSFGHYELRDSFPNGMADLKEITDKIRNAGMALGMHTHYNKAHFHDPYVTPVPDERFHKMRTFTLAGNVDSKTDTLIVNENPKGCVVGSYSGHAEQWSYDDGKRDAQILKVEKELIQYKSYTTEPPYEFAGCKRGHLGTNVSAHEKGEKTELLDVDIGWPIFIRFDQNTDIQDEATTRLCKIINETGPYDMMYFDGARVVQAPSWYHIANSLYRVYKRPEPVVCEAATGSHFSWHMMSRGIAYDSVSPDNMKDFCRKAPCRGASKNELDFTRVNFGWLHGFGRSARSYIGPDVLEFVMSRGAAWDCPFSMSIDLGQIATNPLTEDCFDVTKIWEDARIENKLSDEQREQLKNLEQEHHLFINEAGEYELVAIDELTDVAGGKYFKAFSFQRQSEPANTYVLVWTAYDAELFVPVAADRLTLMRPFGKRLPLETKQGKTVVPVSSRRYLKFAGMSAEQVAKLLREAKSSAGEPIAL